MEIILKRFPSTSNYTEGKLYINGAYFCDTLENKDRGLDQSMSEFEIRKRKIYAETCIPYGEYRVILSHSPKFKRILPEVLNVKGFEGIRFHSGNTTKDTEGCVLVGTKCGEGVIANSKNTEQSLIQKIKNQTLKLIIKYADYGKED